MKKLFSSLLFAAIALTGTAASPDFNENFCDSTLRVDYIFGGGAGRDVQVLLDRQSKSAGWAGRRHHLQALPYERNGVISVVDPATQDTLYTNSFSSLFQEWLSTEEADSVARAYENTFLVPLPRREADIVLTLRDNRHRPMATLRHRYSPADELVMRRGQKPLPYRYLHRGGDPEKAIDVAILAEGYTAEELDSFLNHAQMVTDEILSYTPYAENKEKFNFLAVMSPSNDSGVTIPLKEKWADTAFGSHFSTFHSARYLTTPNLRSVHDALSGIPYEHVVILVNTDNYGGGGIFNSYLMSAARNEKVLPVSVHEFGHSFGGLADEYAYAGQESEDYPLDIEPWAPNITPLVDFSSQWEKMM
ncbi:MAG: IgA Peptidase M64, partial [Muribaculaceae bacterium]|nr:IgA Peptidase M64 [Muribaculaceae bacterium]